MGHPSTERPSVSRVGGECQQPDGLRVRGLGAPPPNCLKTQQPGTQFCVPGRRGQWICPSFVVTKRAGLDEILTGRPGRFTRSA